MILLKLVGIGLCGGIGGMVISKSINNRKKDQDNQYSVILHIAEMIEEYPIILPQQQWQISDFDENHSKLDDYLDVIQENPYKMYNNKAPYDVAKKLIELDGYNEYFKGWNSSIFVKKNIIGILHEGYELQDSDGNCVEYCEMKYLTNIHFDGYYEIDSSIYGDNKYRKNTDGTIYTAKRVVRFDKYLTDSSEYKPAGSGSDVILNIPTIHTEKGYYHNKTLKHNQYDVNKAAYYNTYYCRYIKDTGSAILYNIKNAEYQLIDLVPTEFKCLGGPLYYKDNNFYLYCKWGEDSYLIEFDS